MRLGLVEHFLVPVVLEVPQSDEKMFNWLEVHSEKHDFLQNPYFIGWKFVVQVLQKDLKWSRF